MNKVTTIRLGNYVLTIDEDAAAAVGIYADALRKKYAGEEGAQEIVSDIEERMGELLDRKQKEHNRNFSTLQDVQQVIEQLGPLDAADSKGYDQYDTKRRLFRDTDNKIVAGVWGGIAAYFDIDPVIPRVLWAISVLFFGMGVPLYVILWIVIPEAKTTADKLSMKGKKPTLQNIEETLRSEFQQVSDNLSNPKVGARLGEFFANFFSVIGRFFQWAIKIAFTIAASFILLMLILAFFGIISDRIFINSYHVLISGQEGIDTLLSSAGDPFWLKFGVIAFLLILLSYVGLQLFSNAQNRLRLQYPIRIMGWSTLIAGLTLIVITADGVRNISHRSEKTVYSEILQVTGDTLILDASAFNSEAYGLYTLNEFTDIGPSESGEWKLEQSNVCYGRDRMNSNNRASNMPKQFSIASNTLTIKQGTRVADLRKTGLNWVRYTLHVPKGKYIKTAANFHFIENNYTPLNSQNHVYSLDSSGYMAPGAGNGKRLFQGKSIRHLEVEGKVDVQLVYSTLNYVEVISGPALDNLDWVQLDGDKLIISGDDDWIEDRPSYVRVYSNQLQVVELSGVAHAEFRNWKADQLRIEASGASSVKGDVMVSECNLECNGAANANLEGKTRILNLRASGAADIDLTNLSSTEANIQSSGAATLVVWAENRLEGKVSGASTLQAKGNPAYSKIETSGGGSFKKI
jgi:phage shock protein PspC (stress-responsive transcriptional regulator)